MTAVSCQVTNWALDWFATEGLSSEAWVRELPVTVEKLRDPSQRIDWDLFVALLDRLDLMFETHEHLLTSAHQYLDRRFSEEREATGDASKTPHELYRMLQRWVAPSLFPGCIVHVAELARGRIRLEIQTPENDHPSPLLFALIEVALRFAPRLIGAAPAKLTSHFEACHATFNIELPSIEQRSFSNGVSSRDTSLAETTQQLSDRRYRAISEHSQDVIFEFDPQCRIVYVSPNVADVWGHPPEDIVAGQLAGLVQTNDQQAVEERITKTLQTGNSEHLAFQLRHQNGSSRWVESTASAFRTETAQIRCVLIARDITQRLRVERERRRLASVVENSGEFMAILSAEGRVVFMNEAGRRLLGLSDTTGPPDTIFDCMLEPDAEVSRRQIFPNVLRNGHWVGEYRLRNFETRAPIFLLANIFPVSDVEPSDEPALAIVARDIGDRKSAEQALRGSEQRYRTLVENGYDLVAEVDRAGRFSYVSHSYRDLLGHAPDELLGTPVDALVHPDEQRSGMATLFPAGEHSNHRFQHRDGSWRWLESHTRSIETDSGGSLTVLTSRDITARRAAEDALRESREQLLQSQKMEAIGRLAGGVAHDFNNLLTAITGNCDLLLDEIGANHPIRPEALEIMRAAERAGGLTRQLLAFSRRQALAPKVLELNAVISEIDRLLRRVIGEDIELVTSLGADLPRIKVDPGQLEQLILNLVVNARDAMPTGGRLEIEAAHVVIESEPDPDHPAIPAGEYVRLGVRDSGIGMDEKTASRVFEPFFTTKESGKGTGLGLSTAYGIVQQSHGHIRIDSMPGEGSTFSIYLPRVDELPTVVESHAMHTELRGTESILLVEDSEPVRRLIRRFLQKHGYTVLDAASGIEALRMSRRHEGPLDLLVSDVILPKMDGRELRARILQLRPEIKVLFMSGFSDDALSDHGVLGTDTVLIQKPFTPATLLRKIREELGGARSIL